MPYSLAQVGVGVNRIGMYYYYDLDRPGHATRESADKGAGNDTSRIACIRIPDFTEGEGL